MTQNRQAPRRLTGTPRAMLELPNLLSIAALAISVAVAFWIEVLA